MPQPSPPQGDAHAQLSLDALRDDGQWLIRLARAMGADPAAADDAAQTALIRGWRERTSGKPAPRAWLRAVMLSAK
ncbi:MAG: sigma factor [Planctomycetota bacterium]